ncbi:MAG: hypothetical protein R3B08_05225 [Nitrospira sp.]
MFERLAGCWTFWGKNHGYFKTPEDATAFHDEMCCTAIRWPLPTVHSGSTPGCITPTGSQGRRKATFVDPTLGEVVRVQRVRTSAAACLLHPVDRRRSCQRERHHGSLGA